MLVVQSCIVGIFTNAFEELEWSISSRLELSKLSSRERLLSKMNPTPEVFPVVHIRFAEIMPVSFSLTPLPPSSNQASATPINDN